MAFAGAACAPGTAPEASPVAEEQASVSSTPTTPTTASAPDEGPVKVVVEGPMTGDQAATGLDMWNAAQLAVQGAGGAVLGRPIELVQGDDAADAATGLALAEAHAANTFAVIGPYNSSVGIQNLPVWMDGGAIPIHLTSNNATDSMGFTAQPKNNQIAPIESRAIAEWLKAKTVAIVYDESAFTAGIAQELKDDLAAAGVRVVLFEGFPETQPDVAALADSVAGANADWFYLSTYFPQGGQLAKAIVPRTSAKCFAGYANQDAGFVEAAGLDVAQACVAGGVPAPEQFPAASAFVTAYQAAYGEAPGAMGPFAYDSVKLLLDAVERVGSLDREKVEQALAGTADWPGITGPITIDPATGNRVDVPVVVLDISPEGRFVINPEWASFAGFGGG
jgi:ABC-type branched-subunit amino acid transport system substrate-binding protein